MVICFNFLSGKSRYHAVESGVTSLIPAVGNSWFKTRIFPTLLLTAIFDGRFFLALSQLPVENLRYIDKVAHADSP